MGKFIPKSQNFLLLRLIRTCRISSGVSFFHFQSKCPFLGKFAQTSQNYHLKLKFSTYNNSDMHNSIVMFTFFVFDHKYRFWANVVSKVKVISLSSNLARRLLRICWTVVFTCFLFNQKCHIWATFVKKSQNYQFKLKFSTYNNSNMQNSMVMFILSVFNKSTFFGQLWSKKWKLSIWSQIFYLD